MKRRKRKNRYITYWLLVIPCSLMLIFLLRGIFTSLSAQAADTVLRPILGEQNTLSLESVYFNLQDKLERLRYTVLGAKEYALVQKSTVKVATFQNTDLMDLTTLVPLIHHPTLAGEDTWTPINQNFYPGQIVFAKTFIQPDASRPYAITYLVKMDMKKLGIGIQAGTYYPGGTHGVYGPGIVPKNIQQKNMLLAAFNGGFQERDGQYGMTVKSKTYVPLRLDMPTLFLYRDGSFALTTYFGQALPPYVVSSRQNGPYLIQNGKITPYVELGTDTWGRTITNSMYTWRSGVGVTKEGNLIYAVGNSLVPHTLAKALLAAGAANAIQLDINPPWVKFITYQPLGNGRYSFMPLLTSMSGGKEYLTGYNKDFFYIFKK